MHISHDDTPLNQCFCSPFLPFFDIQELSNFSWALATMDLCDNLMLRAIAEEVDRRGDEVNSWDPQSLSNMTLGYAGRWVEHWDIHSG